MVVLVAKVILYNGLGEKVLSIDRVNGVISVVELPNGVYTAEVFTTMGKHILKNW